MQNPLSIPALRTYTDWNLSALFVFSNLLTVIV